MDINAQARRPRLTGPLSRAAVILLFALFFFYGMKSYNDYGLSWDEPIERQSSLVTYKYLNPEDSTLITDTVNFNTIPDLHNYQYRYYGVAAQYPLVLAESASGFTMSYHDIYLMRHLYVFLWFFAAAACFYRMCRRFTGSSWLSLMGVLFLILSPRILADSFYNIKDSLTLSLYLIASWCAVRFLDRPGIPNILLLSFFGALCTNTRIVGAMVLVCCFVMAFIKGLAEKQLKRWLTVLAVTAVLSVGLYVLMSPVTWSNPVRELIQTVTTFSSYGGYEGTVLFLNEFYEPDGLPWFYLPLWIIITTPLVILLLSVTGTITQLAGAVRRLASAGIRGFLAETDSRGYGKTFLFLAAALPVLYAVLLRPSLYNGWRHFYFIYPSIALSGLAGLKFLTVHCPRRLFSRFHRYWSMAAAGAVFLCLCGTGIWILSSHPYEYAYFNLLARGHVENNFEKDYWAVSQKDQLVYLCNTDTREQFSVWMNDGTQDCRYLLSEENQKRVTVTDNAARADYLIDRHVTDPDTSHFKLEHMYQPLQTIEVDGVSLTTVYQRIYNQVLSSFLTQDGDSMEYTAGNIDWSSTAENGQITWTGQLSQTIPTDLIMVYPSENSAVSWEQLQVAVSSDGSRWIDVTNNDGWDHAFAQMDLSWIQITYPVSGSSEYNQLEVCVYQRMDQPQTEIPSLIAEVSANVNPDQVVLAVDGTELTRWDSQALQTPGMEYCLTLRRACQLSRITLSLGDSPWDQPAGLEIWNSTDGEHWEKIDACTDDGQNYLFEKTTCRYLRFRLGDEAEGAEANWSIYEIQLYGEAG